MNEREMHLYAKGYNQGTIDRADEINKAREHGYICGYVKAIADLKQRFRNEYEDAESAEMEDCINWADWLDATAEQILADRKG